MPFTAAVAVRLKAWPWSMALFTAEAVGVVSGELTVIETGNDVANSGGLALSVTLTRSVCVPEVAM